ncbi:MAG: hypothetical protein K1X64_16965 [Myxococcaceae bacterium]|nr:hypothetical protein [Myxococcaceae bacterium]
MFSALSLCAALCLSQAPTAITEKPPEPVSLSSNAHAPTAFRGALALTAASAAVVGSGVASYYLGRAWPQSRYEELGLPVPLAVSGGLVIAMLSNLVITQLLVPECMRLADDGFMKGDTWEARLNGLRWAKWPALASLASVSVLIAGSAIESRNFGNGQALIAGGLVGFLASWLAYVIVDVWGTYRGYVDSRHERRPLW